jgi:hypothetical protein
MEGQSDITKQQKEVMERSSRPSARTQFRDERR